MTEILGDLADLLRYFGTFDGHFRQVPEREQCVPPAFVVPNSLDGKALRVKHLPQAPHMTTSMLLSHSTSFSSLDAPKPGSRGNHRH